MENISQMSLIEIAILLMEQKRTIQNINTLIKEVLEMKGIEDADGELAAQLYVDITTSSKFVYMGNNEWDLKERQSLDQFDKDGSAFNTNIDVVEDEELEDDDLIEKSDDEEIDEDELDEDEESEDDDESEDDEYDTDDLEFEDEDDEDKYDDVDFDEAKYNEYMDEYEDEYDN